MLLHFKYLVHEDRYTVEKNIERAQFYMPFICETLRSQGAAQPNWPTLPSSSGFFKATSSSGAAGMWQFISSTGKHYGMNQDWWLDERRDPYQSTRAAADYLSKLHGMFNDWHLAISLLVGRRKISTCYRSRRSSRTAARTSNLQHQDRLSDENKQYLPKFLAVCKIARNLDKLGFTRMVLRSAPQVTGIMKPSTDLICFSPEHGHELGRNSRPTIRPISGTSAILPARRRFMCPAG